MYTDAVHNTVIDYRLHGLRWKIYCTGLCGGPVMLVGPNSGLSNWGLYQWVGPLSGPIGFVHLSKQQGRCITTTL